MTWLPVGQTGSDHDAVLALQPEAGGRLLELLDLSWPITDPRLLELCRRRMAQLLGCPAQGDAAPSTDRERAALDYAEQFTIDQTSLTGELRERLARFLSLRQLVAFVQALNVHDGYLRILVLLDLAPRPVPPRLEASRREPRGEDGTLPAGGLALLDALSDPGFRAARSAFGAATARLSGVDELTTECCRLRNASHQACRY